MQLHDWGVDFAVWCTYKYLNAGPGAVGGFYIRDGLDDGGRRLAGWWGNDAKTRFEMKAEFEPTVGARGYQHSNTNILGSIPLLGTLQIIDKAGFKAMRAKGERLTEAFDALLRASPYFLSEAPKDPKKVGFRIITPDAPWRGSQLSLHIHGTDGIMPRVFAHMLRAGVVGDERMPSAIRLTPVVLYNTFTEVGQVVEILDAALAAEEKEAAAK
jgi:kynureninase